MNLELLLLNIWNELKRIFCYGTGLRFLVSKIIKPWITFDYLTDISSKEIKQMIKKYDLKLLLIDMDGTLIHRKYGLLKENKKWVTHIKQYVDVYMITNAKKRRACLVAEELGIPYLSSARKPRKKNFQKVLELKGVSPHQCLMIGDALVADIYGSKRVGIQKTILVKDLDVFFQKNIKR